MSTELSRPTFTTPRALEYFSEKELTLQIGFSQIVWPLALIKELIDNSLDACEQAGVVPEITVTVEDDAVSVQDNGPGLPASTIEKSLDYAVRVSDKSYYVSPTRGQLGNALKCLWAAPFVAHGQQGRVAIITGGLQHHIEVRLDRISQEPRFLHTTSPDGLVKTGTLVKMYWPEIASYLYLDGGQDFYNASISALIESYALFNPHVTFLLDKPTSRTQFSAILSGWSKWLARTPTSPHWYTFEQFQDLIAAYLALERTGGKPRTVRDFVSEFSGLSASAKQKAVTTAAGLSGAVLHKLAENDVLDDQRIWRLLLAMQQECKVIPPKALGVIGRDVLVQRLVDMGYVARESVRYKKAEGLIGGLPYVLEVAFGVYSPDYRQYPREIRVGLNWSPAIRQPIEALGPLLSDVEVEEQDPVSVIVHLACPRLNHTDHGKTKVTLPDQILRDLADCITSVTKDFTKEKRKRARHEKLHVRQIEKLQKAQKQHKLSIKEAAYQVMEQAYLEASTDKQYPALARMMMYAARPLVLELTGGEIWSKSSTFTQDYLPDFVEDHPDLTEDWDVIYDSRGRLFEPHTDHVVDLGGLHVRRYLKSWEEVKHEINLPTGFTTAGPTLRYQAVLFIEKEGFHELLMASDLLEKYDLALMSTKGVSNTATRRLVDELSSHNVTTFVVHDFDKSGFTILHTLRTDTRRYQFQNTPKVIDLGLRLEDVLELDLQSEEVFYKCKVDPRINLAESGATPAECDCLVERQEGKGWVGKRVELNALMSAGRFLEWLEKKLIEHGLQKVIPEQATLEEAYRRAWKRALIQEEIERICKDVHDDDILLPHDLDAIVRRKLREDTTQAWDAAIWGIVQEDRQMDDAG